MPPLPIGFVAFDLDYYSSTRSALRVFKLQHLPRVYCYFDDTIWPETACHNDYTGELCAIREFNMENSGAKLCQIHGLSQTQPRKAAWNEGTYVLHDFEHRALLHESDALRASSVAVGRDSLKANALNRRDGGQRSPPMRRHCHPCRLMTLEN